METGYTQVKSLKTNGEWKQVEDKAQGLFYPKQNSKAFAIPILTAI